MWMYGYIVGDSECQLARAQLLNGSCHTFPLLAGKGGGDGIMTVDRVGVSVCPNHISISAFANGAGWIQQRGRLAKSDPQTREMR
jgi:hypothetical protein